MNNIYDDYILNNTNYICNCKCNENKCEISFGENSQCNLTIICSKNNSTYNNNNVIQKNKFTENDINIIKNAKLPRKAEVVNVHCYTRECDIKYYTPFGGEKYKTVRRY